MLPAAVQFVLDEEAAAADENIILQGPIRVLRDRLDPLNVPDNFLLRWYRLPRNAIVDLCQEIGETLQRNSLRSRAIPVPTQILTALRFYASGSFQNVTGDVTGVSQSSCSRIVRDVSNALTELSARYITFPLEDEDYIARVKSEFHNIANFPNIIGVIDGTLINIKAPSEDEPSFVDRYRNHSINCQVVCGPDESFSNIVVRWPGSTHDQFVWNQSMLKQRLDDGVVPSGWLLGDSGYGIDVHLLTPFANPATVGEENYNRSFKRTRSIVERSIGILKSRFRCIDESGGTLMYKPLRCCKIITSCCVLHNWCVARRIPILDAPIYNPVQAQFQPQGAAAANHNAVMLRAALVANRFI